jgi:hypothetical protein
MNENINDAKQWIERIRAALVTLEDVLAHADSIRGDAFVWSLRRTYDHAEGAHITALQTSVQKRS